VGKKWLRAFSQTPYGRLKGVLGVGVSVDHMASRDLQPQATVDPRSSSRAGFSPSARRLVLCAVAVATALVAATVSQAKPVSRLKAPSVADVSRASRPIVDTTIATRKTLGLVPPGYWGGEYTISTGEKVTIYASNSYAMDPALEQRWADFLGTLFHGSEISQVTVLLSTAEQISQTCGSDAVACFAPQGSVLYTPGDDPAADLSAEAVITHEYGHNIAAHRSNPPWNAVAWGPKRWASSIQVCAQARKNELVPGAEDEAHYAVNPGEGWAETYRVLNQRRAGTAESPWDIVSQSLYPTDAALVAAAADVTTPWAASAPVTTTVSFPRPSSVRTVTVSTPLDGTLRINVRPSRGLRVGLNLFAGTTRAAHAVTSSALTRTTTVCGTRSYRVRIQALKGRGSVRLSVSKP
jgi:hypothetical protein